MLVPLASMFNVRAGIAGNDSGEFPAAEDRRSGTGIQPLLVRPEGQNPGDAFLQVEAVVKVGRRIAVALIEPEEKGTVVVAARARSSGLCPR